MTELELRGATFQIVRTADALELGRKANRDAVRKKWRLVLKHALDAARAAIVGWRDLTPMAIADLTPGFTTPEGLTVLQFKLSGVGLDAFEFTRKERDGLVAHSGELFAGVLAEIRVLDPEPARRVGETIQAVLLDNREIGRQAAERSPVVTLN